MPTFAVTLERFNRYDFSRGLREQDDWDAHARFMDDLTEEGFVLLGGPLPGGPRTLLIVDADDQAAIEARLAADPWTGSHLRIHRIEPWEVLLRSPVRSV